MPTTNRPFFLNLLAAFRPQWQSPLPKSPPTTSPSRTIATTATATTTTTKSSSPSGPTTTAIQAANPSLSHTHTHTPRQPSTSRSPPAPGTGTFRRARRGSDTSSEGGGFRDRGEKWYVGGKTAGGEERYLRLGVVRKERSGDRLSLDRLSL